MYCNSSSPIDALGPTEAGRHLGQAWPGQCGEANLGRTKGGGISDRKRTRKTCSTYPIRSTYLLRVVPEDLGSIS